MSHFARQALQKLLSPQPPQHNSQEFPRLYLRHRIATILKVAGDKRFVYVRKNADPAPQFYVGLTSEFF